MTALSGGLSGGGIGGGDSSSAAAAAARGAGHWRRWRALFALMTIVASAAAPAVRPECGCVLDAAAEHVLCRQIGRLCFKETAEVEEGVTVRRLTLSDAHYSGALAFNYTDLKNSLGVDLSQLEEVEVRNTRASRIELCSDGGAAGGGGGGGARLQEHQISCAEMVRLRKVDLRDNALTSLADLGRLPAIAEIRISGEGGEGDSSKTRVGFGFGPAPIKFATVKVNTGSREFPAQTATDRALLDKCSLLLLLLLNIRRHRVFLLFLDEACFHHRNVQNADKALTQIKA